jgi:hypothetical protein
MRLLNWFPLLLTLFVQGCAFAPFSNTYSAKTVGKKKWDLQGGLTGNVSMPFVRAGYGFSDNTEVGVIAEHQMFDFLLGGYIKYAFVNPQQGPAFSIEASAGAGNNSNYAYIGPIMGYQYHWWEGYLITRFNHVDYKENINLDLRWLHNDNTTVKGNINYLNFTLGNTLWFNKIFGLNLNANYHCGDIEGIYWGAGLVLKL